MKSQIESLKETLELFIMKYNPKVRSGVVTEKAKIFKRISPQ